MIRILYLLTIFLSQFLFFLFSFSLLTFFSFNNPTVDETAMSVFLFSLGSLFSLGIFRLKIESSKKHLLLIVLLFFGLFSSSVLIFSEPKITLIIGLGIMRRLIGKFSFTRRLLC